MNKQNKNWSRRKFFQSSALMLGATLVPSSSLFSKAILPKAKMGSSISMPISYRGKTLGVKFTIIDNSYVVGTFRLPKGKKVGHFFISGPSKRSASSKKVAVPFKLKAKRSALVSIDPQKGKITTNVKGITLGSVKFLNSPNDDVPSSQGFFNWLKDKVNDVAAGIAVGISYLTGDQVSVSTSGGGVLHTHKDSGGSTIGSYGGFIAEDGIEEQPGVWY